MQFSTLEGTVVLLDGALMVMLTVALAPIGGGEDLELGGGDDAGFGGGGERGAVGLDGSGCVQEPLLKVMLIALPGGNIPFQIDIRFIFALTIVLNRNSRFKTVYRALVDDQKLHQHELHYFQNLMQNLMQ